MDNFYAPATSENATVQEREERSVLIAICSCLLYVSKQCWRTLPMRLRIVLVRSEPYADGREGE